MAEDQPGVRRRKHALRAAVLARRDATTLAGRDSADIAIARHGLANCSGAATVAAYLSIASEPPTAPLIVALTRAGVRVIVPVVDGDGLDWVAVAEDDLDGTDDSADLPRPGAFGIPEPGGPRLGRSALGAAEVVLVPALAADRAGNRLGRGRGYYDRALAAVSAPVIAIVYDDELLDEVPVEPHDRPVQAVLTPSGWFDVRRP